MNFNLVSTITQRPSNEVGTNHLGHFLLTQLLIDNIIANKGRVINLSSRAHISADKLDLGAIKSDNRNRSEYALYAQSKLANVSLNTLVFIYALGNVFT
jgi:NAD(P)-dependent dehydrogenase (short-subunit alcohol dehydrogenase family)